MTPNHAANSLPDVRKSVRIHAPIARVWEAVATAEGLAAWFMPNDFQPVVGHEFHLEAGPYGKSPCRVTEVDPPHRLAFRWGKDWTATFELIERDGATECTVIHSGWQADGMTEFGQPHPAVRGHMAEGWAKLVQALAKYVEG